MLIKFVTLFLISINITLTSLDLSVLLRPDTFLNSFQVSRPAQVDRKESYKAQRKSYAKEKKRVERELLSTFKDQVRLPCKQSGPEIYHSQPTL